MLKTTSLFRQGVQNWWNNVCWIMSGFQARTKLAETEKLLSGVLYERGVDSKGFAIIRSKGDKALFRLDTALLKRKLGAPDSRPLADFLPTISDGRFSCAMILPSDDWEIPDSCDDLYLLISRFSHKDVILSAIYFSICK